jgi:hypothetical protein
VEENGQTLDVIEVRRHAADSITSLYNVYLATKYNYVPMRYIQKGEKSGEILSMMEVTAYKECLVSSRTILFPTAVRYTSSGRTASSPSLQFYVDEPSLRINEEIADSVFDLNAGHSDSVFDKVQNNQVLAAIELPKYVPPQTSRRSLTPILWGNVIVIGLLTVFAALASFRRRQLSKNALV